MFLYANQGLFGAIEPILFSKDLNNSRLNENPSYSKKESLREVPSRIKYNIKI